MFWSIIRKLAPTKISRYTVCGDFHQKKIFANFATCSHWQSFITLTFRPLLIIAWRPLPYYWHSTKCFYMCTFCPAKIFTCTVLHVYQLLATCMNLHACLFLYIWSSKLLLIEAELTPGTVFSPKTSWTLYTSHPSLPSPLAL